LTNGHLEKIDEKISDKFLMLMPTFITAREIDRENNTGALMGAYNNNALR